MKKYILFVCCIVSLFNCCKRPNQTTTVNSTFFNCKVNGVYWEPDKGGALGEYNLTAKLLFNETVLSINAARGIETIHIGMLDTLGITSASFDLTLNEANSYTSNAQYDNNNSTNQYETDSIYTGNATIIKIDKANMIVEGTFSFTAYNQILLDNVNITDGKFKLKYTKQ